jgi:phage virion morphogenesis protein
MAGTGILKAKYDSDFQAIIDALSKAAMPDLEEIANFAGGELAYISQKAFENEEDPVTGKRWEPLKRPRPDGSRNPILDDGGQLIDSLNWQASTDGSVVFGSNMVYARIHQKGGKAGRGRRTLIKARPYMGVPSDFDRRILNDPAVLELLGLK